MVLLDNVEDCFQTYKTTVRDYKMDKLLQMHYFHNLFDAECKRFYRERVYENVLSYDGDEINATTLRPKTV